MASSGLWSLPFFEHLVLSGNQQFLSSALYLKSILGLTGSGLQTMRKTPGTIFYCVGSKLWSVWVETVRRWHHFYADHSTLLVLLLQGHFYARNVLTSSIVNLISQSSRCLPFVICASISVMHTAVSASVAIGSPPKTFVMHPPPTYVLYTN